MKMRARRWWLLCGLLVLALLLAGMARSGRFLVVDQPRPSDLILVLEGEADSRPQRALELLRQGLAPRMWIDADSRLREYEWTEADLATIYFHSLPPALAARIRVRPETDLSTKEEAQGVAAELGAAGVHSVLLVTSEFHTRRALTIYRREVPGVRFSVAAAYNSRAYGVDWWRRREWAKRWLLESLSFAWWEGVDRWRR